MTRQARTRPQARSKPARDQHESAFATILAALVRRAPGARGAALVDLEGETVDFAGSLAPYDVKLAAAHWRIVLDDASRTRSSTVSWIAMRASRASYLVHALPEEYALVVVFSRGAGIVGWRRAIAACARSLSDEAGWRPGAIPGTPWFPVDVEADERRRPASLRVAGRLKHLEVLGRLAGGLGRRERGWRVRSESGVEATLVREPGGVWYADEPLDAPRPRSETKALTGRRY